MEGRYEEMAVKESQAQMDGEEDNRNGDVPDHAFFKHQELPGTVG